MSKPRISVCVPAHYGMENYDFFMERLVKSLDEQSFRDFELIVTHEGSMPVNSNAAIKKAKGEIIKILYMDDYLYSKDALKHLNESFVQGWFATGCVHDNTEGIFNPHYAKWEEDTPKGINTIGSPSVVAFANDEPLLFDERMSWMLDIDLYRRLYLRYGPPTIIDELDIAIGIGTHQMTHLLSADDKENEVLLFKKKLWKQ